METKGLTTFVLWEITDSILIHFVFFLFGYRARWPFPMETTSMAHSMDYGVMESRSTGHLQKAKKGKRRQIYVSGGLDYPSLVALVQVSGAVTLN